MSNQHCDVGILQPGYLPWLGYFDLVAMSDVFVMYDDVQFDRGGWRNRNRLLQKGQPQWLTVPVVKSGHAFKLVREIEIMDTKWPVKHLSTIRTLYGKAPFFDWCYPTMEKYLARGKYKFLVDLCAEGHRVICELLGIARQWRLSSEIGFAGIGRTERLVAICSHLNATRYIATDASKQYMIEPLWRQAGIALVYQHYPHPTYKQASDPFVSHLSIVDSLMFAGPKTRSYLGISHSKDRGISSPRSSEAQIDT